MEHWIIFRNYDGDTGERFITEETRENGSVIIWYGSFRTIVKEGKPILVDWISNMIRENYIP